ncbi:MAG: hypothetical protein WBO36_01600 [Saprospiraceae bacterium]
MRHFLLFILLTSSSLCVNGQSINTEFGKNRIQFHDDFNNWWEYETENFITYWYGKARFIAQPTIQMAEIDHDAIQKVLEHRMNDKIEIIVYVDVSDVKQSNIGTEETFISKTGETKIVGNKMFVYFDGNHQNLRHKIREGIATVYLNNMLFGSNIQEIIQNAVLLNIPDWYKQGVVAYAASEWNHLIEDELRDIWERNPKYHNFSKLAEQFPRVAGHSFWFYIDQNYGKSSISNLLYLTKISRGTDNSFEYILNADLKTLMKEWENFYKEYYSSEKGKFQSKPKSAEERLKNKKYTPISNIKLSPKGDELLYAYNDQGKFRVVVRDLKSKEEKIILKYGYKNVFQETDFNYPLLAWHPTKPEISIAYEHRDIIKLVKYRLDKGEKMDQIIPTDFQRLYSMSYIDDLNYIFSGSVDGFSDLFLYKSKNRNYERLTTDFYDDLDAEYVTLNGRKGILFSSNRTQDSIYSMRYDTILPLGTFDIWFLPDGEKKAIQLTKTILSNERYPYLISDNHIVCTGDVSGMINTYTIDMTTQSLKLVSNLDRNLIRHHAVKGSNRYVSTYYSDGMYKFFEEKLDPSEVKVPYRTQAGRAGDTGPIVIIAEEEQVEQPIEVLDNRMLFQSEFADPPNLQPIKIKTGSDIDRPGFRLNINKNIITQKSIEPYNNTRAVAANSKFALHNITTKLDNDILFEGLETYTGDRQQLLTAPMGILLKANVKDLFEDYEIEAGVRIPTTFNGSEYFLVFNDRKSRIDKKMALYRKSNEYNTDPPQNTNYLTRSKKTTLLGLYQMKYPFDIYRSVRATSSLRFDRFMQLSTENNSFLAPVVNEKRLSLKLEYIYDNTYEASLNIRQGSRYKFYTEFINQFDMQVIDGFKFDLSKGFTGIFGFDARHYVPVLKYSVLALRLSGATSVGNERMLYFLGGVENGLIPKFDNTIPVPNEADFAYKVNAFHLRGFNNNIRNGTSFVLSNAEFRFPFMQYILGRNRGSAFFRHMQITGFYDAGLAWHGSGPFSAENPLNKIQVSSPPLINIEVEYFRDPLVMGYGVGFRTQLLGYFIKVDYAWGIETRKTQDPKLYLSMGLDF